nr:MAG TPA: hypothetical protein [Caudoviricetes sp.]
MSRSFSHSILVAPMLVDAVSDAGHLRVVAAG